MSLQVQYRPSTFTNYFGNEEVIESVKSVLDREHPPSAFLITGPSGCGKTTLGRIIARALGCKKSCFQEINSADDRSISAMRLLISDLKYPPLHGPKKVILLDEAHQILKPSQEALLKALEEPPDYAHWIICTTNPEALRTTFKRRCHNYEVSLLTSSQLIKLMRLILKSEKVTTVNQSVLDKIVELSDGSAGIALKYLDMVVDMEDSDRALATLRSTGTTENELIDIERALANLNVSDLNRWNRVKSLLKNLKSDGESARRPILGYFEACLLNTGKPEYALIMDEFRNNFYDSGKPGLILACYKACFISEEEEDA